MAVYAIGDLHLSGSVHKAMDVFGPTWSDHVTRIEDNWRSIVKPSDIVLIPGDISWATRLEDAKVDLAWLGQLPGRKILVRGNHDYWWTSPAKVRRMLPNGTSIIQNDAIMIDDTVFCGTRGWVFPTGTSLGQNDQKIYDRERIRLRLSLDYAQRLGGSRLVVLMHYPPLYEKVQSTGFVDILEEYAPAQVVFGHLHGRILEQVDLHRLRRHGIEYKLVSADYVGFCPVRIDDSWLQA